ncbi:hypothetical protein L211DRAFT_775715 [Terfezia boudieri ATCC MYA-4762]|uniref:Uncharacterized protein n=1 Tax=Terfezia boudieri ATCC MYA-4762 TaxID=1051890 RepID=A0A3N4M2B2_9PEZI|nr:hypothetical protein L211DRAFT_775715 [Terfezia boudieri ATCC MYA-4762]
MKLTTAFAILLAAISVGIVNANTPLSDAFVNGDLTINEGFEVAFASRPLWHFGQSNNNKPCYPAPCFNAAGQQYGLNPTPWPNAGQGCPNPGPIGSGNSFPTYYTITRCNDVEVRVAYNLYFQKDRWSDVLVARGHMHDWERIIVIWRRDSDNMWRRKELLKSFHAGYMHDDWATIQNTINYNNPDEQAGKDKDGAKIYVGWGKHAMFSTRNTGWNDPFSQGCSREFRSRDWRYLPTGRGDLVFAGGNSDLGRKIQNVNWGSAASNPVVVEQGVCGAQKGGYTACSLADGGLEKGEEGNGRGKEG